MLDPHLVDVAELLPGVCATCRSINGPFVDTRVDTPWGRVYICAHTCGPQLSDLCQGQEIQRRDVAIDGLLVQVTELQEQLVASEASRVVPLEDVNAVWRARLEQAQAERREFEEKWLAAQEKPAKSKAKTAA